MDGAGEQPLRHETQGEGLRIARSTHHFANAPTKRGDLALRADIYRPHERQGPWPLVVWVHAGGFRGGSRTHRRHRLMAHALAGEGYASAFIDYRLARPRAVLAPRTERVLPALLADAARAGEEMHPTFLGTRPMAAVEDLARFFGWLQGREAALGLSGDVVLGGSSAGAITALNALMLNEALALELPRIRSALILSGGFGYPSLWRDGDTRILAIHNPSDDRVPFSSIDRVRRLSRRNFRLITAPVQEHGAPMLRKGESLTRGMQRLVAFDRSG
ncbi:MAG: hypothetical protein JJU40_05340 [Rhodobacteraceae bacterium]|nr:hypothetical protein [Paracoccaceae bacterium]